MILLVLKLFCVLFELILCVINVEHKIILLG